MDLIWWPIAIAGCLALALCIAAAFLRPMNAKRRILRPLANVGRLTELPQYVRAARRRAVAAIVTFALLCVMFAAAVATAARPTGMPSSTDQSAAGEPEDIMLCIAQPATDPAAAAVLGYFAKHVTAFGTQRIGLTSSNRRVVPLTRDYQYAAAEFGSYAAGAAGFVSPVSYVDYAGGVEDLMALCLTGFPDFDREAAQRRSLIYVGPDSLRTPLDSRPSLFTADRVRDMAGAAGVQVNVLITGSDAGGLARLARDTGGQALSANDGVDAHVDQLRARPPAATAGANALTKSPDSPDIPLLVALLAATVLAVWPVVRRR
ncbi:MAG: hypothetical protein QOJ80_5771 [Mycobacterium sp.]|nr:hypothetical protein [Mycobacterium sp.]